SIHDSARLELKHAKTLAPSGTIWSSGEVVVGVGTTLAPSGALTLWGGTLSGFGAVATDVVNRAGTVRPGAPTGTLLVAGDYQQRGGGTVECGFNGWLAGNYDGLAITGAATLGGTLDLRTGYVPLLGDSFHPVTYASETGTPFDTILGQTLSSPPDSGYSLRRG